MIFYNYHYDGWTAIRERAKRAEAELENWKALAGNNLERVLKLTDELERVKAELLALKVTEEHTFAAQRIAETDVEELKMELEKRDAVIASMKSALLFVANSSDGYESVKAAQEALTFAKEAGL